MEHFSSPQAIRIVDVNMNRFQTWLERGYIAPSVQVASGHGTRNIFSREDLYRIALFKRLVEGGILRESAAPAINLSGVRELIKEGSVVWLLVSRSQQQSKAHVPGVPFRYLSAQKEWFSLSSGELLERNIQEYFSQGAGDVLVIDLSSIIREVDAKIQ